MPRVQTNIKSIELTRDKWGRLKLKCHYHNSRISPMYVPNPFVTESVGPNNIVSDLLPNSQLDFSPIPIYLPPTN